MPVRECIMMALAVLSAAAGAQSVVRYAVVPNWLVLPEGRTAIGSMHGDVAVSGAGEVYVSVEGSVTQQFAVLGPNPGLQVYSSEGRYLRTVECAPSDLHGFVIHRDDDGTEFIYGARLAGGPAETDQAREHLDQQVIVKLRLDGTLVMAVPASRIPDQFKNRASDSVHRFDRRGTFLASC